MNIQLVETMTAGSKRDFFVFPCRFMDRKNRLVEVRPYREDDYESVVDMYDRFEPKGIAQGLPPPEREVRLKWIENSMKSGWHMVILVEGTMAGNAVMYPMRDRERAEWGIFIHQDFQEAGIGAILAQLARPWAASLGFRKLWLVVERFKEYSIRVYTRAGFTLKSFDDMEADMEMEISGDVSDLVNNRIEPPSPAEFNQMVGREVPLPDVTGCDSVFIHTEFVKEGPSWLECPLIALRSELPYTVCRNRELLNIPGVKLFTAPEVSFRLASFIHDAEYLRNLYMAGLGVSLKGMERHGFDPLLEPALSGAAKFSMMNIGATLLGARLLAETDIKTVFNPCGGYHHVLRDSSLDGCYVNDVLFAIHYLVNAGMKVFFLDLDTDRSDVLRSEFSNNEHVASLSFFEVLCGRVSQFNREIDGRQYYHGNDRHIEVPVPAYTDDRGYMALFDRNVVPMLNDFAPDVLLVQMGLETLGICQASNIMITKPGYGNMIQKLSRIAPKILAFGGSGQKRRSLRPAWPIAWAALISRHYF